MNRFLLLFICACIVACGGNREYTVTGTINKEAVVGDSVFLQYIDNGWIYTIGRDAVNNSSFSFKGECSKPRLCYIVSVVDGKVRPNAELFIEPGDISVKIGSNRSILSGTLLNTRLQEYNDSIDIIDNMFMKFYNRSKLKSLSAKAAEETNKGIQVLSVVREEYINRFIEKNIDNPVATYIISKNHESINPEKGIQFISQMPIENKSDTSVRHIEHTFRNKIMTAEGKKFLDFNAFSNEGKKVKLSDFVGKGKIVVLNLWSTTGRKVQSNVSEFKAVADKYKGKVEFMSFAIDKDVAAWNNAIKKYEMWWSHISDMKGWDSRAVFSYGINSFPYNIIFSADGTILHKGVNSEELYSLLDKML